MSNLSWSRHYRPQQVSQLHLTSVRKELQSWMKKGRIPQVILLAGPKGTGKTSTARILSALVNDPRNHTALVGGTPLQEPDLSNPDVLRAVQGNSLAIHEQDAASNRGIDDVRSLREQTSLPPAEGIVAVYILDEVHMFTTEAFNALLKLLEEPPSNVLFVLATTEIQKIPATILSRCALLQFTKATQDELVEAMSAIAKAEKIKVDPEVLQQIADRADGSFRDAVKWFEQLSRGKNELSLSDLESVWPREVATLTTNLISSVITKDAKEVSHLIAQLRQIGVDQQLVHEELYAQLHHSLLQAHDVVEGSPKWPSAVCHFLLKELLSRDLKTPSPIVLLALEIALLDIVFRAQSANKKTPTTTIAPPSQAPAPTPTSTQASSKQKPPLSAATWVEQWPMLLQAIRKENASLSSLLSSAKPVSTETAFVVEVYYPFHLEQLTHVKHQIIFDNITSELFGAPTSIPWKLVAPSQEATASDIASALL